MSTEEAFVMRMGRDETIGILHRPDGVVKGAVLIIVGGPQYRVGSHRLFVDIAREFSAQGYATMRFDYRGMGDSDGPFTNFEQARLDVDMAIDALKRRVPEASSLTLFGLCDAASAALMYGTQESAVTRLILLNPWVRTTSSEARTMLKHYYGARLLTREFWQQLFSGKIEVFNAVRGVIKKLLASLTRQPAHTVAADFRSDMLVGAQSFSGKVLLIMSGDDYTAREFESLVEASSEWQQVSRSANWSWQTMSSANHTFSTRADKQALATSCIEWFGQS